MGVRLGTPYFLPGLLTGLGVGNFFLGVAQTQIAFDDARIVAKLFGFAFQDDFAGFQNVAVVGHLQEIGRAACRQRVCQYVVISWLAGYLNTKNMINANKKL